MNHCDLLHIKFCNSPQTRCDVWSHHHISVSDIYQKLKRKETQGHKVSNSDHTEQ